MALDIREVGRGQPIRADDQNRLVRAVRDLAGEDGTSAPEQGMGVHLRALVEAVWIDGVRYAEDGPLIPAPGVFPARSVRYDVRAIYKGFLIERCAPDLGRIVERDSLTLIVPAAIGDKATVIRFPDGEGRFEVFVTISERLRFGGC